MPSATVPTALTADDGLRDRDSSRSAEGRRLDLDVVRGLAIVLALGLALQRHPSGNVGARRPHLARPTVRLGRRRPLLRAQRLPARPTWCSPSRRAHRQLRRPAVHRPAAAQALAGPLRLPRRAGGRRPEDRSTSYLWQNALHLQNYAGTSLTAPVVAGRRGALLPRAGRPLPALRPAPGFTAPARRRSSSACSSVALALRVWVARTGSATSGCSGARTSAWTRWPPACCSPWSACTGPSGFERARSVDAGCCRGARRRCRAPGGRRQAGRRSAAPSASRSRYLTAAALLLLVYRRRRGCRGRAWSPCPWPLLGRYSYGIYIWHVFAAERRGGPARRRRSRLDDGLGRGCAKYGAAIARRVLATVAVEKPVLRLRDRLAARARPPSAPLDHAPSGLRRAGALGGRPSVQRAGALAAACRRRRRRRRRPAARSARPAGVNGPVDTRATPRACSSLTGSDRRARG